jgi:hypothetical protein
MSAPGIGTHSTPFYYVCDTRLFDLTLSIYRWLSGGPLLVGGVQVGLTSYSGSSVSIAAHLLLSDQCFLTYEATNFFGRLKGCANPVSFDMKLQD